MKKIHYLDTIDRPLITEKATMLSDKNKVVFKVIKFANKKILKKILKKFLKLTLQK